MVVVTGKFGRKGSQDIWAFGATLIESITGFKPWSELDNHWAIVKLV